MCTGNSDGSHDIACAYPAVLRPHAPSIEGRDAETCTSAGTSSFARVLLSNAVSLT